MEKKIEKRIRNRKSYKNFEGIFNEAKEFFEYRVGSDLDLVLNWYMQKIYSELNSASAFGSSMHAGYARESLDLLLKDKGVA